MTYSRREILRYTGMAVLETGCIRPRPESRVLPSLAPLPGPFQVPLPILPTLKPVRVESNADFYDVTARESIAPRWRDVLLSLRRMEARGEIRGGRFVATVVGEQFALPEAIEALRAVRRSGAVDDLDAVSAYDPLHFAATLLPQPAASNVIEERRGA